MLQAKVTSILILVDVLCAQPHSNRTYTHTLILPLTRGLWGSGPSATWVQWSRYSAHTGNMGTCRMSGRQGSERAQMVSRRKAGCTECSICSFRQLDNFRCGWTRPRLLGSCEQRKSDVVPFVGPMSYAVTAPLRPARRRRPPSVPSEMMEFDPA